MNYGQMRDFILKLINRYSNAGALYTPSYNNQQDYLLKIPALINDALIYIATSIRRIPAQKELPLDEGELVGGQYRGYVLPEDCLSIRSGGLFLPCSKRIKYFTRYVLREPDLLLIPAWLQEDAVLEYYRRPQLVPDTPDERYRVDADMDVQMAVCYYVAAHLVMTDDEYLYTTLYNEFENKASRLVAQPVHAVTDSVVDVYGAEGLGGMDV